MIRCSWRTARRGGGSGRRMMRRVGPASPVGKSGPSKDRPAPGRCAEALETHYPHNTWARAELLRHRSPGCPNRAARDGRYVPSVRSTALPHSLSSSLHSPLLSAEEGELEGQLLLKLIPPADHYPPPQPSPGGRSAGHLGAVFDKAHQPPARPHPHPHPIHTRLI